MVHPFNVANAIKYLTLDDGLELPVETINKAKSNDGEALRDIGYEYKRKKQDYSKAMAWCRLAANQNNTNAYNNIGVLYHNGLGVSQDYLTAMEYYLKAARDNQYFAMGNISLLFLNGNGVPVNKYKALEWLAKSRVQPEQVKELNKQGIHLIEEDKSWYFYEFELYHLLIN
jgi:TPR repeat protein